MPGPSNQRLWELAYLPPSDARRAAVEAQLAAMDSADRYYWRQILMENDHLHAAISATDIPPSLQAKLLRLPDAPFRLPHHWLGWKTLIAAILAPAIIASSALWLKLSSSALPLDNQLAMSVAQEAVQTSQAIATPEIADDNICKLSTALQAHELPFPVIIPQPSNVALRGGGVADIHGKSAFYTRWQADGATYTLYELDSRSLGLPADFAKSMQVPRELWHDNFHPRVVIFPGPKGYCAWALVMENDSARDVFSGR